MQNPASRFLLHVLGAAAEFERSLIRERTQAGRLRYQQDYDAGKVGKTVYSRSGKNLPIGRPKRIFNRERVIEMRQRGGQHPGHCAATRRWGWDGHPNLAGAHQNNVEWHPEAGPNVMKLTSVSGDNVIPFGFVAFGAVAGLTK